MHIAVDADDVVVDFVGGLLKAMKKEYGVEIKREAIVNWDLHPVLDPIIGGPAGKRSFWGWLQYREWLWANFEAIDGAVGCIDQLRRAGHYMELVTSKPDWAEHNVWKFLGKWRPAFHRVTIVGLNDIKANLTEADILIDDKPDNCLGFLKAGRQAILFTSPHNKSFPQAKHGLVRANDWPTVVKMIFEYDQTGHF